jgi:hypothetical protein
LLPLNHGITTTGRVFGFEEEASGEEYKSLGCLGLSEGLCMYRYKAIIDEVAQRSPFLIAFGMGRWQERFAP